MRSVRTLVSQGHLLPVLVLALLLVDSLGEDLNFHPEWGFDSSEITIPRKLSFRGGKQGTTKRMSYLLQVQGKKHVVHLWPKRFLLPRHLQVFSYTEEGELVEDHPYIPRDCNYVGVVEGAEDSEATLSTCAGGLRGILKIDAKYYQIEPLRASSGFEHAIYLLKNEGGFQDQLCGITGDEKEEQMAQPDIMARYSDFADSVKHQRYLELAMVFDHDRYLYLNSNLSQAIDDAILMAGVIDTYYQEISLRIHLKGVEVWTTTNKVRLSYDKIVSALTQFRAYRTHALNSKIPADWEHIYIQGNFTDRNSWHWGKVCGKEFVGSGSVIIDKDLLLPAIWTTHEIGHSVGMEHDTQYCQCRGQHSCIMGTGRTGFSNCSYNDYINYVRQKATCLTDIPGLGFVVKKCGNKIVEDNEECDCGSKEDCEKDHCCEPDCKFKQGATCSTGLCCHKCHFRPSGYVCREVENECDLAEYCNGTSSFCPNDTYKQDGTPCKYDARCFQKGCWSTYMQCQRIFGSDAREAPDQCYEAVNLIGDQYGNCGIIAVAQYEKCTKQNSLCGRVQCINVPTLPDMPDHMSVVSTHLQNENLLCWGLGYHPAMVSMGIPDLGVIHDGTSCGKGQICWNRTCVDTSILKIDCVPENCNDRGFCNNNRNCHCVYGWAPPFCEDQGYGGSVDSGPPRQVELKVPASLRIVYLLMLRVVLFALSVTLVILRVLTRDLSKLKQKRKPPTNTEIDNSRQDEEIQVTYKPKKKVTWKPTVASEHMLT
ncbi:Disintegrin and metalloproteinase domain-containing protein 30 [Myotis brandtii]|uniref:Disintegrin and metalloproteinase domain-containing protein 30 n=1 Tax=Myotis brandtii TaxID=109478 RepID=S7NEK7_MYOBR|nr:PREDICTED: disintegrin and metalloproteinase domain-containing protein 30-like [Myotis brandtii]EPQ15676.1 Disintegrin and metalloproteinase domain-containing protein 30 [Myotis brandtii]